MDQYVSQTKTNFHQKVQQKQDFEDDSYGEEDQSCSSDEQGELDSAQKQNLKRDLLMMGYDDDDEFPDEVHGQ